MTRDEIMEGLNAGRTLVVDRSDNPHLRWLIDLANKGEITAEFVEYDEQSSAIKFSRKEPAR